MKHEKLIMQPMLAVPEFVKTGLQACADIPTDIFYPYRYNVRTTARAKRICGSCPFIQECGTWAIRVGEAEGVWGSLDPHERRKIRADLGLNR